MMSDSDPAPSGASGNNVSGARRRRSRGGRSRGRGRGRRGPRPAAAPPGTGNPSGVAPEDTDDLASTSPEPEGTEAQDEGGAAGGDDEQFYAASPEMEVPDHPAELQAEERAEAPAPLRREERPAPRSPRDFQPAEPASVRKAIDEVMEIVSSLRDSLDKLDELLELLEEAERQKTADEREIESLRQALRRFQRPPDEIPRQRPQHPQGGRRDDHRPIRDHRSQPRSHRDQRPPRDNRDSRPGADRQPIAAETNPPAQANTSGSSDSVEPTSAPSSPSDNGPDVGSPS